MAAPSTRSFLPRSLFGRALTILLVPIVLLQLVVGLVFFQRHYQRVTEEMTAGVVVEIAYAVDQIEELGTADAARRRLAELSGPLDLSFELRPDATVVPAVRRDRFDFTGQTVVDTLRSELDRPVAVDFVSVNRAAVIDVGTTVGALRVRTERTRLNVANPHQLLVLMIVTAMLLTAIAVVFLRNQVRPIRQLAEASEAFGKGRSLLFRPRGAEEVRRAGAAFLAMRSRIERQIEQRTQMLSGVSHDLRTPLTRMKLTLELMDDTEDVADLRRDVAQMDRMLGEFLAFARGGTTEATSRTDPFALAAGIVEDARRAGARIELVEECPSPANRDVEMRAGAVRRAVQNLVANAAHHGTRVRLSVRIGPRYLSVAVEDDGPGIPAADRARALQPFTRLDTARSQEAHGNVGLGLSIALDTARSHGGTLELAESDDLGGLRAVLRLPR